MLEKQGRVRHRNILTNSNKRVRSLSESVSFIRFFVAVLCPRLEVNNSHEFNRTPAFLVREQIDIFAVVFVIFVEF